ncbi:K(+)-transporting ATPase subunit C [Peterkaempfera sp. SMS 1(5)a]|uniref:K(+)-transporting ATPase subunit C n=1 Tax=Peterkaempfera podocarpi TaxID=3232308 RepID=UPI00366B0E6D
MAKPLPTALRTHLSALRMLLVMTVILGIAYPLLVTGAGQVAFHNQANGSLVKVDGKVVGSSLLGQSFDLPKKNPDNADEQAKPDPKWFQPRPSAGGYDPTVTGASNLGPNSTDLLKTIQERRAAVAAFDGVTPSQVPADAVTASGSGLDPDISPAYAREQVTRVAKARGLDRDAVAKLVEGHVQGRQLGFLGNDRVNVLELNKALSTLR